LHDVFYILRMRLDEPGFAAEAGGTEVIENQSVEKIDFFDAANRNVTAWFHHTTLLPVRQRFQRFDPLINGKREELTRYSKFRDAGDRVQWPFAIERERDGEKIFQMFSEQVKVGEPLDGKLFELPPGITILKK
jgi:hypothetical protein